MSESAGLPGYGSPALPDFVGLAVRVVVSPGRTEYGCPRVPDSPAMGVRHCRTSFARQSVWSQVRDIRSTDVRECRTPRLWEFDAAGLRWIGSPCGRKSGTYGSTDVSLQTTAAGLSYGRRIGELVTDMSARLRDITVPVHLSWDCRTYRVRQLGGASANCGSRRSERRCR